MMVVQCRDFFEKMLSPFKKWVGDTRVKVDDHNANLEAIKSTVLMTIEEQIKQEVNRQVNELAAAT